jgi:hypothetical protein
MRVPISEARCDFEDIPAHRGHPHHAPGSADWRGGVHNNHHAFPSSPRFSVQDGEIDVGWLFICLFRALGLAQIRSLGPTPKLVRDGQRGQVAFN